LAEDIRKHGLREPLAVTPDGKLIDGKNRRAACELAGVEPATFIEPGDPWEYAISRNEHRRNMSKKDHRKVRAALAKRASEMATASEGRPWEITGEASPVKIEEAAKANRVTVDDVKSYRVIEKHGTPEEKAAIMSGAAPLRGTADKWPARSSSSPRKPAKALTKAQSEPIAAPPPALALGEKDAEINRLRREAAELGLKLASRDTRIADLESALAAKDRTIGDLDLKLQLAYEKGEEHHALWKQFQAELREKDDTIEALEAQLKEARDAPRKTPDEINATLAEAFPVKAAKAKRGPGRPKGDQPWLALGISSAVYYQRRGREKQRAGRDLMGAEPPPVAAPPTAERKVIGPFGGRRRRVRPPVSPATA
jgi:hypothetical protein